MLNNGHTVQYIYDAGSSITVNGKTYSLVQFLSGPLMGNLSDRFGRRPLMLLAVFGLGIDFLIHAVAPSVGWLFVGRVLAGFCGASKKVHGLATFWNTSP